MSVTADSVHISSSLGMAALPNCPQGVVQQDFNYEGLSVVTFSFFWTIIAVNQENGDYDYYFSIV